jgi:hypothetical protein
MARTMAVGGLGVVVPISKIRDQSPGRADPVRTNHALNVTPLALGVNAGMISYPVPPLVTRTPFTMLKAPVGPTSNPSVCRRYMTTRMTTINTTIRRIFITIMESIKFDMKIGAKKDPNERRVV